MAWLDELSMPAVIAVFLGSAGMILFFGWRLAARADQLADVTGLGEAVAGALLLGFSTSLPGVVTSVGAAYAGRPELSVSNAIGGIAVQTAFLALADLAYREANLEHAAASVANIMQGTLLVALLAIPLLAAFGPDVHWFGIHPATPVLLAFYLYGIRLVKQCHDSPMWRPKITEETRQDRSEEEEGGPGLATLLMQFALLAGIVGAAGVLVLRSALQILEGTGLSEAVVGGFMTAVVTSLPELVTSVAAVRQGALTLAVSGIIGGNAFDTLFLAFSDVGYRSGSIYHAMEQRQLLLITLTILMTAILLMGLVRRERSGIANIGFESFGIAVLYLSALVYFLMR